MALSYVQNEEDLRSVDLIGRSVLFCLSHIKKKKATTRPDSGLEPLPQGYPYIAILEMARVPEEKRLVGYPLGSYATPVRVSAGGKDAVP